jgi:hypothetical protein
MTSENLFHLAETGKLGQRMDFGGYCMPAAIDSCFEHYNVPLEVYEANRLCFDQDMIERDGDVTEELYQLIAQLAFKSTDPELYYYFNNLEELRTDLSELRGHKTILLDTNDAKHSVGLKPFGKDPDEWQIVGSHQIIAAKTNFETLDVQCMAEPEVIATEQVWEYLLANNSPDIMQQTAIVFPAEPL